MEIIERVAVRYEAEDVEFGRVYSRCPETVLIECDRGKRSVQKRMGVSSGSVTICECVKDCVIVVREELVIQPLDEDEAVHPRRYWRTPERTGIPS